LLDFKGDLRSWRLSSWTQEVHPDADHYRASGYVIGTARGKRSPVSGSASRCRASPASSAFNGGSNNNCTS
jgi:hypothetical protein